jgi:hypothetical protein
MEADASTDKPSPQLRPKLVPSNPNFPQGVSIEGKLIDIPSNLPSVLLATNISPPVFTLLELDVSE